MYTNTQGRTIKTGDFVILGTDCNWHEDGGRDPHEGKTGEVVRIFERTMAGYNALVILHTTADEYADDLDLEVWQVIESNGAAAYDEQDPDPFGPYIFVEVDLDTVTDHDCVWKPVGDHGTWVERWECDTCGATQQPNTQRTDTMPTPVSDEGPLEVGRFILYAEIVVIQYDEDRDRYTAHLDHDGLVIAMGPDKADCVLDACYWLKDRDEYEQEAMND
jgi:hypothetical protein